MSWRPLFGGSRFIFWALAPVLILFAIVMPLIVQKWTPVSITAVALLDSCALLLAFGLYNPSKNEWALRCVTGIVFVAYLAYLVEEIREGKPLRLWGTQGEESLRNALLGLILIGWPCIKFTLSGFDGWKHEHESAVTDHDQVGNSDVRLESDQRPRS